MILTNSLTGRPISVLNTVIKRVLYKKLWHNYAHEVTAAILLFQNYGTVAMLVYRTNPMQVQLFPLVNTFFCSDKFVWLLET